MTEEDGRHQISREESWRQMAGGMYERVVTTVERVPPEFVEKCLWCGDPMFDSVQGQKFCSTSHRVAYWRYKKRRENGEA